MTLLLPTILAHAVHATAPVIAAHAAWAYYAPLLLFALDRSIFHGHAIADEQEARAASLEPGTATASTQPVNAVLRLA